MSNGIPGQEFAPHPIGSDLQARAENAVRTLDQKLLALESNRVRLEEQVLQLENEQRRLLERCLSIEEQNTALSTLYVACQRLHSGLNWSEVLSTTREIIANLVGCEEYVLFTLANNGWLRRVDSFGVAPETYENVLPGQGLIGRCVETGEPYFAGESDSRAATSIDRNLTACIPLKRKSAVSGAIALFRLLPQKLGLQPLDRELFRLLETHLATALYFSELAQTVGGANGDTA